MLTILHTESSTGWGGQEIRIMQESLGVTRRGHKVIIAAPENSNIYKRANEVGINTVPADFKRNPMSVLRISTLIKRERPDIVNTHSSSDSWVATIAAKLSSVKPKIIRTRHLSTPIRRSYFSRLIYEILPDAVITTGEEIRQRMIHDNGFSVSKIFSIPTGIDLDRFNPAKTEPAFKTTGFSVGMIGVLRSWKGHRFFIEAVPEILSQIPDAVFYIIGDGPQSENIKNLIQKLSLQDRVFMLGYRVDIPEVLQSLNVVIHPSYANEGVPQSILQALAMKKPVVASDTGSIKEVIIDGKTGLLIPTKNPYAIASKVIDIHKNPILCARFGEEGRRLVEKHYSINQMLDKLEKLYKTYLTQIE